MKQSQQHLMLQSIFWASSALLHAGAGETVLSRMRMADRLLHYVKEEENRWKHLA